MVVFLKQFLPGSIHCVYYNELRRLALSVVCAVFAHIICGKIRNALKCGLEQEFASRLRVIYGSM